MNTKIATKTAQQGDVILKKVNILPSGEKKLISKRKMVLAEGEVTGHYHGIEETNSELFQIGDKIFLSLNDTATVTHQEHGAITLDKGVWEVGRVKEYDYFTKMVREVKD
jgi:hypothetical protein